MSFSTWDNATSSLQCTIKTKLKRHVEQVLKGPHAFSLTFKKMKATYKITQLTSEELLQLLHKDHPVLPSSVHCFWKVNEKHLTQRKVPVFQGSVWQQATLCFSFSSWSKCWLHDVMATEKRTFPSPVLPLRFFDSTPDNVTVYSMVSHDLYRHSRHAWH